MATDSYVQIFPDSTGKKMDTSEVTRSDGTTVVERERLNIADPEKRDELAEVSGQQLKTRDDDQREILFQILEVLERIELRLT